MVCIEEGYGRSAGVLNICVNSSFLCLPSKPVINCQVSELRNSDEISESRVTAICY
jgi:hypothetical protein